MSTQAPLIVVASHPAPVCRVAVSRDGAQCVTADTERQVRFWNSGTQVARLDLRHPNDRFRALDHVRGVLFSPGGDFVFIAAGESLYQVDASSGQILRERKSRPLFGFLINTVQDLAQDAQGRTASVLSDGTVEIFDPGGEVVSRWKDKEGPIIVGFTKGGALFGTDHYHLIRWDPESGRRTRFGPQSNQNRIQFDSKVFAMATSPLHRFIAVRTLEDLVLINPHDFEFECKVHVPAGLPRVAWSSDGSLLASLDEKGVTFHAAADLAVTGRYECPADVHPICVTANQDHWLIGQSDGAVVKWPGV